MCSVSPTCASKWSPTSAPERVPDTSVSRCSGNSSARRPKTSDDACPFTVVTYRKMQCGLRDAGVVLDLRLERDGEERLRRVRDAALEETEVGAADVDEVGGGLLRPGGDREQGDDEADADGDARPR